MAADAGGVLADQRGIEYLWRIYFAKDISMKRLFFIMLAVLMPLAALSQERLVVVGVGDLVVDEYEPRYVVLTEEYAASDDWMALDGIISDFVNAHPVEIIDEEHPLFDWDAYIGRFEMSLEEAVEEGENERAEALREMLQEIKAYRKQVEDPEKTAAARAEAEAVAEEREALLAELRRHAVGGRLFFYAEAQDDARSVEVQLLFDLSEEGATGTMDASGQIVIRSGEGA